MDGRHHSLVEDGVEGGEGREGVLRVLGGAGGGGVGGGGVVAVEWVPCRRWWNKRWERDTDVDIMGEQGCNGDLCCFQAGDSGADVGIGLVWEENGEFGQREVFR